MELWSAFVLGLAGSLHCAGMCGPLVLALAKARAPTAIDPVGRVCYHLGRIVSYGLLGWILGWLGRAAAPAGFQRGLSIALGIVVLAGMGLSTRVPLAGVVSRWVVFLKSAMTKWLPRESLASQAVMGGLNGLLPCGLVYVAAAGATAASNPWTGAAYMAVFGLGTWPMMLSLHLAGHRLPLPARLSALGITRSAAALMGALLILRGLELGIPLVSPDLSSGVHCH